MNLSLDADFHPEEVWYALTQMHHHKSSRPDGTSPFFFQKCCYLVGDGVTMVVLTILNSRNLPAELNHTFIF